MSDLRTWLDKGDKSSTRMPQLLPILIRQARLETPITYGDAATELGVHHRAVDRIAGYIGYTLDTVGKSQGWKSRRPPPLHLLVVNDVTRLPGHGVDGDMSSAYRSAKTKEKKRAILKAVYADMKSYGHWDELFKLLEIEPTATSTDDVVKEAVAAKGRGGEGPEHKALKDYVADHPELVGLASNHPKGTKEFPLASGDSVDVVFNSKRISTAVEVKSAISSDGDIARGLFQCLKYRVVLEKQSELSLSPFAVRVLLVLGGSFPEKLIPLRNSLDVFVVDNVARGVSI